MTSFASLDDAASKAAVLAFGETALLRPRSQIQYAESPADMNRNVVSVRGVFSARPARSDLKGQSRGSDLTGSTRVASTASEFWIAASDAAGLGFSPTKGDLLTLAGRPGCPTYAVASVQTTDLQDLNLLLVREDVSE
ncbi:MAG: hypothetical protein B7Y80_21115 [Hyphomicrobium sp. 32-62-53]|nr:MAG: hypothetical protein B7Z29_20980 [Hyphomicrobium sp. 12-62-95]OYX97068.1 MAG: hypothetical protein B7Y80_21115 [Hyphomicrobium sp. 32-62-53]